MHCSWHELLAQLETIIGECGLDGVEARRDDLITLLRSYASDQADFEQFVHYDDSGYTKNLVKRIGKECNIIVMCWAPGQSSAYHAHEGSKCFVKVLFGELIEQQVVYPKIGDKIDPRTDCSCKLLSMNDVTCIDDSIGLHQVRNNSSQQPAITLHIYTPPYTKCRIFQEDDRNYLSIDNSHPIDVTFNTDQGISPR